ncbi:MAG: anaerobic ribonucleoside-triphosphate reductase activating protein [Lactobacillaceae bacterium]|jgi:anaerobic ribonucleoside-triphosphate reductase activating protein|nr:anaerobic ribonucleoside-triphosphate reductase activating protein [Lactobacillaceae bacterium]
MDSIRIAGVVTDSIVDGPGVRYTIFTQGCSHKCPGCHNPQTHDYNGGILVSIEDIIKDIESFKYIKGVTFSGGEPFDQPKPLAAFIDKLKSKGYHILAFSGYTFEQLSKNPEKFEALKKIDVLIDGKFDINLKSLDLKFRGSGNQRMIDVQETLKTNQITEMD